MSALASLCGRAEARALRTSRASARASRDEGALRFEIPLVHLRSAWSILDDGRDGGRMQVCSLWRSSGETLSYLRWIHFLTGHLKTRSLGDFLHAQNSADQQRPTDLRPADQQPADQQPTDRQPSAKP